MSTAFERRRLVAVTGIAVVAVVTWLSAAPLLAGDTTDSGTETIIPGEKYTAEHVGPSAVDSFADRRAHGIPQYVTAQGVKRAAPRALEDRDVSSAAPEGGAAPAAPLAGTAPTLGLNFEGARFEDSWYIPPDTMGAIGPNHFMEVINGNVSIFRKSDGFRLSSESLDSFFSGSGVNGLGDPRVLFDHHSSRWFVLATNFGPRIGVAVSTTDDPTGSFFKTNFLAATGSDAGTWVDYPTLGVDEAGVYTGAYMVGRARMTIWAIDKAPLIDPSPSLGTVTAWRGLPLSLGNQPAHTYGTPGAEYIIGKASSSALRIYRVDPPLTAPTMTDTGTVSVASFSQPPDAPAQGSSIPIDTVGDRLMMSVYRDGSLWTTHCVGVSGRAAARWYEIDPVTRTVIQYGTVADSVLYYYFPSLMVNSVGDVAMGFSGSEPRQYVACYYTGRQAGDPAGEMAAPQLLKAGEAPYEILDGINRNRWGDYSYTTLDPIDQLTFWTIQEYAETPEPGNPYDSWGTWIGELTFVTPTLLLEGECFYDVAMQEPVMTVAVEVINVDTGASWDADTADNYYSLILVPGVDVSVDDKLRLIAKDGVNWINVTDHIVTQGEIDAGGIYLDLILDEFYLDLNDFPMYEADAPEDQMCGPAVAQMTLNYMFWDADEYPIPPMTFDDQQVLYDYGIANNETPGLDYLDMLGMWHTIQDNCPLPYTQYGYNFGRRHDTDSDEMLKQIAQWIANPIGEYGGHEEGHPFHVPGVIPAYGGYTNWMAVRGIHTDQNAYPLPPELQVYGFWVNDPYPASLGGIGENSYKTSDDFVADYYWALSTGDSYDGEYVAIVEPPEAIGDELLFRVPSPHRFTAEALAVINAVQTMPSPPPELVAQANMWIVKAAVDGVSEQLIPYDDDFAERFEGTTAGTPLFVNNNTGDDYYAVPFDAADALAPWAPNAGGTTVVVLVDAEDGGFKEASWVRTPVKYLPVSRDDALRIAHELLLKLRIDPSALKTAVVELVHIDSTPYYPHWRIAGPRFLFLIAQDGSVTMLD
jgi:hypothetical protein